VVAGELDEGAALIERALSLNPNLAIPWNHSAWVKVYLGEPEAALDRVARAMRLSPHDPYIFDMQTATACAHFLTGHYEEALPWAEAAARAKPTFGPALRALACCSAATGRQEQAHRAIAQLRELYPTLRVSNLRNLLRVRRAEDLSKWEAALRQAGLPE
jgi:tetratricopeptide (TPR) repeat protein